MLSAEVRKRLNAPYSLGEKMLMALIDFTGLSVIYLILVLLLRIFELIYSIYLHEMPPQLGAIILRSLHQDLLFYFKSSFILFIFHFLLFLLSQRMAAVVYIALTLILSLFQLGLIEYFNQTSVLLGADLYGYSWSEIRQTVGAGGGLTISMLVAVITVILIFTAAFYWLRKRINAGIGFSAFFVITVAVVFFVPNAVWGNRPALQSDFANNLATDKLAYFLAHTYAYFFPSTDEIDIYADSYLNFSGSDLPEQTGLVKFNHVDHRYPFLHVDDTKDVLSSFLNRPPHPPNIVILLVEGLGRAFTGRNAYLGSFTPFLDSLGQQALYWENFLSNQGRTFGVLPSVLGSLPFAKTCFSELGDRMPPHLSLVSILKKNGYHTRFYYGGDSHFDGMDVFLQHQSIDEVIDESNFGPGYSKLPGRNDFTWGYGDKDLLQRNLADVQSNAPHPKLDIILTVAMHNPFLIPDQEQYYRKVEQRMQVLRFNEAQKTEHRKYLANYATILYMDEAMQHFFSAYSQKPEFNNTIFLITGDHRMPEIPMTTKIDRYHVPLIIYSPLLQRTARFASLSSHFDITPSLLAYLKHNFSVKSPSLVTWLGSGLDTVRSFRNVHQYPLKQTKTDLVDYVMGDYMISENKLFGISSTLNLVEINDDARKDQLVHAFTQFKQYNDALVKDLLFLPDSLYKTYHP